MDIGFYEHNSILGGLNLFLYNINKLDKLPGARPPFPIIIDNPSFKDAYYNLNKADLTIAAFWSLVGATSGLILNLRWKAPYVSRVKSFHEMFTFLTCCGVSSAFLNSCYRLKGLVPNGLSWEYRENIQPKYNFTEKFLQNSWMKYTVVNFRQ